MKSASSQCLIAIFCADGSYRKPIKVRETYASEELDPRARAYVSKGTQVRFVFSAYLQSKSNCALYFYVFILF